MKTSSAKAKARKLQDLVRDTFRYIFKEQLEPDDIKCAIMGTSGVDILLSPAARKLILFDIEAKNQEKLQVPAALRQASDNAAPGRIPLLVFKKNNGKVYAALEFEHFVKLLYNQDLQKIIVEVAQEKAKSLIEKLEEPTQN